MAVFLEEKVSSKGKTYIPLFFFMFTIVMCIVAGYAFVEQTDKSFTNTSTAMGVQIHQMLCGGNAEFAAKKVREKIQDLENKISYDIGESDVEKINNGAGEKWIKASPETINALDKFINISKKSRGTIDPTVLPLISIWGFDCGVPKYPEQDLIEKTLKDVDYRDIKINRDVGRVKIENKNGAITLKQIEKGIACSAATDIYKELNVDYGVISVGGTVGVYGKKPDNSLWKVSIRDPFIWDKEDSRVAHIKVKDGYVATFGLKCDKININGVLKNKILNIKTEKPIENNIASVSILHSDAIVASALSQICYILDKKDSLDILNYYGAEAVFVYENKEIYITPKLKENFNILDNSYTLQMK